MNILLLEDDVALNKAITKVLKLDKHHVTSFIDGRDLIKNLEQKYALYILDINVPHISGLELLKIIMEHNSSAKVIMISSNTDIQSIQSAYNSGCVDYLKKPFYIEELRMKISRLPIPQENILSEIKLKHDYDSLSKNEKKLLFLLLDNQEYVVTYEMIEDFVYEERSMTMDALRALVRRLRAKLSDDVVIKNIVDEGYTISIPKKAEPTEAKSSQAFLALQKENILLKLEKELLLKRSTTDPLTELYNRLRIKELFLDEKEHYINKEDPLSLILIDLDNFKAINDQYGHNTGDRYLKTLAATLKEVLRSHDIIGRWGGEEFIILLPNTSLAQAETVARNLKKRITEINCPSIGPRTASFGLAKLRKNDTLEGIIQRADEALLRAKKLGKNRIEVEDTTD
ncbi:GGDEF domain-containing response regulator [Sulfurovum riftiae]|uniref:diguanylate cyclase n=1 Tax=Sulfurovum riftiae TaxID=1630136 RepID=A0A151CI45_9BACT|nr:diguanylate cyclase [Sulfurovum riftiae]KYJ87210.1 hypothetical protein AS592_11970 [Sulfurovum riftiae]